MNLVSECCSAPIIYSDICSDCKEHCEAIDLDDETPQDILNREESAKLEIIKGGE